MKILITKYFNLTFNLFYNDTYMDKLHKIDQIDFNFTNN